METLMKRLPDEIILHILGYSRLQQSCELLNDIESVYRCKKLLMLDYQHDVFWILSDLIMFLQSTNPSMHEFIESLDGIIARIYKCTPAEFLDWIREKEMTASINIILGMLTPMERIRFVVTNCITIEFFI